MENEMKELVAERMDDLRKKSGEVVYTDALTSFFYELIRDHIPAGVVEELVNKCTLGPQEIIFTNGWLAKYSNNLAESVVNAKSNHLQVALNKAFVEAEEKRASVKKEKEDNQSGRGTVEHSDGSLRYELNNDEFAKLEEKLIKSTEDGKVTKVDKAMDPSNSTERATDAISHLLSRGHLTEEEAKELRSDISDAAKTDVPEEIKKEHKEGKVASEEDKEMVDRAIKVSKNIGKIEYKKLTPIKPVDIDKTKPITVIPLVDANDSDTISVEKIMLDSESRVKRIKEELKKHGMEYNVSDKTIEEDVDRWTKKHSTTIDVNGAVSEEDMEKWKNTNEELQKINKEELTTDEE